MPILKHPSVSHAIAGAVLVLVIGSPALAQVRVKRPLPEEGQTQTPEASQPRLLPLSIAPAPVDLGVEPQNPGLHKLRWNGPGGSQYRVYRRDVGAPSWTQIADGVAATEYLDRAIVAPGTSYRVETIQPNTLPSGAEIVYANPPRPESPQDFRGVQDSNEDREKVNLYWKAVANATGYRIFGPGQPPDGTFVDVSHYDNSVGGYELRWSFYDLPPGTLTFSIASVYGEAGFATDGMPTATVDAPATRAHYRITLNGFRCLWPTGEDPILHGDGKGDEIFLAVFVGSDLGGTRQLDRRIVRTRVHGDVLHFPDRIQTGSSSPSGGIGSGDSVPATAGVPQLPVTPAADQLPLVVWDGVLWNGDAGLAIAPTIWEWDGDDANYKSWSGWLLGTEYDWLDVLRDQIRPGPLRWHSIGPFVGKDWSGITIDDSPGKDVPIGYSNIGMTSFTTAARKSFSSRAFIINRGKLESLLGRASTAMLAMNWNASSGSASYDMFLQVERLPRGAPVGGVL